MSASDNFQRVINLLQCPECKNTMSPPILMCSKGHNICHACRPVLQQCYICRNDISEQRNDFAESVSKLIPTACRFSRYGCREQVNHEQRSEHEDICPYQPVECWAGNWNDTVAKCGWQGKQSDLLDHVRLVHGVLWVHVGPTMEGADLCDFDRSSIRIVLLCAFEELFWLTVKYDLDSDIRMDVVQYTGPRSRATLFEYKIQLESCDRKSRRTSTGKTKSCFEDVNEILAAKHCYYESSRYVKKVYANSKKYIPGYRLTLSRVLLP